MKIKKDYVDNLLKTIDLLIDIKLIIRETTPNYNLDDRTKDEFLSLLKNIYDKLNPIFSNYLKKQILIDKEESFQEKKDKILDVFSEGNYLLVTSNSAKKILKDLGADPRNIIVSGGPFFLEDYKKVNPNIPIHALKGIEQKCKRLREEIKNENWIEKDLFFLHEKNAIADKLTLNKINLISELIGKEVKTIEIESWDNLIN